MVKIQFQESMNIKRYNSIAFVIYCPVRTITRFKEILEAQDWISEVFLIHKSTLHVYPSKAYEFNDNLFIYAIKLLYRSLT